MADESAVALGQTGGLGGHAAHCCCRLTSSSSGVRLGVGGVDVGTGTGAAFQQLRRELDVGVVICDYPLPHGGGAENVMVEIGSKIWKHGALFIPSVRLFHLERLEKAPAVYLQNKLTYISLALHLRA